MHTPEETGRPGFLRIVGTAGLAAAAGLLPSGESLAAAGEQQPREGRAAMKKELEGLRWRPRWVSHLGCVLGCVDYLGSDISCAWLYGGTAHAFIINIHKVICPSGPTAWNTEPLLIGLPPNIGYSVEGVFGHKGEGEQFAAKQRQAWDLVCKSIDQGVPCYGWELDIPEFYVIHGYDDVGYYYSGPGCDEGAGPKRWQEVGDTGIGAIEIMSVRLRDPAPDAEAVKAAFSAALRHAENPREWINQDYRSGPAGFELWAEALESGKADRFGQGYNAAVWAECRGAAVSFLGEAKQRLAGKADDLFDQATQHYSVVAAKLKQLSEMYPFNHETEEGESVKSPEAAALVREAGAAEEKDLEALGQLVGEL